MGLNWLKKREERQHNQPDQYFPGVYDVQEGGAHPVTLGSSQISLSWVLGVKSRVYNYSQLQWYIYLFLKKNCENATQPKNKTPWISTATCPWSPELAPPCPPQAEQLQCLQLTLRQGWFNLQSLQWLNKSRRRHSVTKQPFAHSPSFFSLSASLSLPASSF